MNIKNLMAIAGVPESYFGEIDLCLKQAEKDYVGVNWKKLKTKLFKAGKISKMVNWETERLCIDFPEYRDDDVAPVTKIKLYGDNGPWECTPEGDRPLKKWWTNQDPNSEEYKEAVKSNYWCEGEHPKSQKSVKAWLRRNGGEYLVYRLGMTIDPTNGLEIWHGSKDNMQVSFHRASGAWIINTIKQYGPIAITSRYGYECDNVYSGIYSPQAWFPIDGYELKAPVTRGWRIRFGDRKILPSLWESPFIKIDGNRSYTYWKP